MAIRCGYSVGRTTGESSLSDQLQRFKPRNLRDEKAKKDTSKFENPAKESLKSKCVNVIVANFAQNPITEFIPPQHMAEITNKLPSDLSPLIGAKYVYNEAYWKRCCVDRYGWHNCQLLEHGLLWKQVFFEKLLQEKLEDFNIQTDNLEDLYDLIDSCMDYIFTITFKQLPSHLDLCDLCSLLPNLTKLDVSYGVNKIGMNYERMLFGMKISDATNLAKLFESTQTLSTLILAGNMIDDDLLRVLMTGLIKNNTITHLDVSHNKITNHGARLLSKLLGENSVMCSLNVSDNHIHTEGGRYFARGLRENDALLDLNLRLNHLADDGCRLLLEGLQDNLTLTNLNLSSNYALDQATHTMCSIIRDTDHHMSSIDMSGNLLTEEMIDEIKVAMTKNKSMVSVDLRRNPGYKADSETIKQIEKMLHDNDYHLRK